MNARFEGAAAPSSPLDAILYDDFADRRRAREAEHDRIDAFVDGIDADLPMQTPVVPPVLDMHRVINP